MNCAKLCWMFLLFASVARPSLSVPKKKTPEQLALPRVSCSVRGIKAVFGPSVKSNIRVKDNTGASIPVPESDKICGVSVDREKKQSFSFVSKYDSCYAHVEGSKVIIPLQVQLRGDDRWFRVNISCPLIQRYSKKAELIPTAFPGNCDIERALRVDCGPERISSDACSKLGCCYDSHDLTCFYTLNACSLDGHFVFSVKATDTDLPIDPSSLIVKDHPQCSPVVSTADTAVFKIGIMECGATMKVDGDTLIYEVDVEELHTKGKTKNQQFSLQVKCEYEVSDLARAADFRSLYAVTNPPPVIALGTIKVQMRIAKDGSFTSFFPEDQLPLKLPLRKAAYVEISITQPSPDPTLSLRVRDCFAYPESRHSVWTLLYDGCPNPLDKMRSSIHVDKNTSQVRRFDVKTFAFVDPQTGHASAEEMYFYCWVEICPNNVDCVQRCTISPESERQRREAKSKSDRLQLISIGPLILGQNSTEPEDGPCVKQNTMFQVTLYTLTGVGSALLMILLFTAWSNIRKQKKPEAQQACDAHSERSQ